MDEKYQAIANALMSKYPALAPYNFKVMDETARGRELIASGKDIGPLEFYHAQEGRSPNPGQHTIGILNPNDPRIKGNLESAIFGDMLHALPENPKWRAMRQALMDARHPEAIRMDRDAYEKDKGLYDYPITMEQWEDINRSDAWVRGWLAPDNNNNWRSAYTPEQIAILQNMRDFLTAKGKAATK